MTIPTYIIPLLAEGYSWYYWRTVVQPQGFVIAMHPKCRIYHDKWKNAWSIGGELWPNVLEVRTPTAAEVANHWGRLRTATPEEISRAAK